MGEILTLASFIEEYEHEEENCLMFILAEDGEILTLASVIEECFY